MKTLKKIIYALFLTTAFTTISCTPEENVVSNPLVNSSFISEQTIAYRDSSNNYIEEDAQRILHFETNNTGRETIRNEHLYGPQEASFPFTYTYKEKFGAITYDDGTTLEFVFDPTHRWLRCNGMVFIDISAY